MIYIILATLFYSAALLLSAPANRLMDTNTVVAITNILATIIPVGIVLPFLKISTLTQNKYGVLYSIAAGVCIAFFGLALAKSFSINRVGIITPIVFGGTILITSVIGTIIFKEKISLIQMYGLGFVFLGIILVAYAQLTAEV